jgi:hypothetical protein
MNFISDFMDRPVDREFSWMTCYFKSGACADFLKYFSVFRTISHFSEHVGRPCSLRWANRMKSRFVRLEAARAKARADLDFELLADIETGKFKLN